MPLPSFMTTEDDTNMAPQTPGAAAPAGGADAADEDPGIFMPGMRKPRADGETRHLSPAEARALVESGDFDPESIGRGTPPRGGQRTNNGASDDDVAAARALFGWTDEQARNVPPQVLQTQIAHARMMMFGGGGAMPGMAPGMPGGMPGMPGMPGMMPPMPGGMPHGQPGWNGNGSPPAGGNGQPPAAQQGQKPDYSRLRYQFQHIKPGDGEDGYDAAYVNDLVGLQDHIIGLIEQVRGDVSGINSYLLDVDLNRAFKSLGDEELFGKGSTKRLQPGSPQWMARQQIIQQANQWAGANPALLQHYGVDGLIEQIYNQMHADRVREKQGKTLKGKTDTRASQAIARPTHRKSAGGGSEGRMSARDIEIAQKRAYARARGIEF